MAAVTYNKQLLEFLHRHVEIANRANRPASAPVESLHAYEEVLSKAQGLIKYHSTPIDLTFFYTPDEVHRHVHDLCSDLRAILHKWNVDSILEVDEAALKKCFNEDTRTLCSLLAHVFTGEPPDGAQNAIPEDWAVARKTYLSMRKRVHVVGDEHVTVGQQIGSCAHGTLHEAVWKGGRVVVKFVTPGGQHLSLGSPADFAAFYREVCMYPKLDHPKIVRLFATSTSGWIVMEHPDSDLEFACLDNRSLAWSHKLKLLQQSAACLKRLHTGKHVVHQNVRSSTFLSFGDKDLTNCKVRISDLGAAIEEKVARARLPSKVTGHFWMAPEVCQGEVPTFASDVYGFGIVMYEVVTAATPYGAGSSQEEMLEKKLKGVEPCVVKQRDCPDELLELMRHCCKVKASERPTMEEVNQRLSNLSEEWVREVEARAVAQSIFSCVQKAREHVPVVKYNCKMMEFLLEQMDITERTMKRVMEKEHIEQGGQQPWRDLWNDLGDCMLTSERLIRQHTNFNLQKFYRVEEAKEGIGKVLDPMNRFAKQWAPDDWFQYFVPPEPVAEDKKALRSFLEFVFLGKSLDASIDEKTKAVWQKVRDKHLLRLEHLTIVEDKDIAVGERIGGSGSVVYHAQWRGQEVAVKKLRGEEDPLLSLEEFAQFFTEACTQASLSHPNVAKLLAVSRSGQMVMELATCDLERGCQRLHDWRSRVKILDQVADGLEYMHNKDVPVYHCDVKSPNILLFGDKNNVAECTAQISDFGISTEDTATGTRTVRRPRGTPQWMAPETYESTHPTAASDVFSFGVVMYEVASQSSPYGGCTVHSQTIMKFKHEGRRPCEPPRDCPIQYRQLMESCCFLNPRRRPCMREIREKLQAMAMEF